MNQQRILKLVGIGLLFIVGFIILTNTTFLTIEPGHEGVKFRRFGGGLEIEKTYTQGFHVIAPWNKMYVYDVRIQEGFEQMSVLSKNGLTITIDLSYRFRPKPENLGLLHNQIGKDYRDRIVIPEIRSATREVIGQYLPEELYSTKREVIQKEIFENTKASVENKHILLDAVLIREVVLPESLQAAIERKLKEEQESLQYEYRLEKERKEAERKVIEANAKAEANRIVAKSLTDEILQDKGIDATLELANSSNTKVIVIGSSDSGLPLILGSQ